MTASLSRDKNAFARGEHRDNFGARRWNNSGGECFDFPWRRCAAHFPGIAAQIGNVTTDKIPLSLVRKKTMPRMVQLSPVC